MKRILYKDHRGFITDQELGSWEQERQQLQKDKAYVKAQAGKLVPYLEKALDDPNLEVRERALDVLMDVPEVGLKYVRMRMESDDAMTRDDALARGLMIYPDVSDFREHFFRRLVSETTIEGQGKVLVLGSGIPVANLSVDQQAKLRAAWERQAKASPGSAAWVMPLVRLGDQQSYTFLREMALSQAGSKQGKINYSRLHSHLVCGLAILGDAGATAYLAEFVQSQGYFSDGYVFECACDNLASIRSIQLALLSVLPDANTWRRLLRSVDTHQPPRDTEFEDEVRVRAVYRAATVLATALEIPATRNRFGMVDMKDVINVRAVAAKTLGVKIQ